MLSDIFTQDGMDFGLATSGNDSITMSRLPAEQLSYFDSSPLTDAVALLEGDDYAINNGNPRIFYGNQGNDTAIGGANNETLFGGQNNDFLDGDFGDDLLFGNKGNDDLNGGFGNDQLYGGQDNDVVVGGAGNDTISGDRDLDTLTGGDGADEFFLASSGSDRDVITDFQPGIDKLRAPSGVTRVEIQDSGSSILILNNGGDTLATLNNLEPLDMNFEDFIDVEEVVGIDIDPPTLNGGQDDGSEPTFEQRFAQLVNQERTQIGLQPLEFESLLREAARTHSTNMALQDFYGFTGVDGSEVEDHIQDTGFLITGTWTENIGAGYTTPEEAIERWMENPETRDTLLNPDYTEIGVGHYFLNNDGGNANFGHYWTAVFHDGEPEEPDGPPDEPGDFEEEVRQLINQERTQAGLQPLEFEPLLTQAAETHSTNMALQDFYDHTGADGSSFTDRIEDTGFLITGMSAENIGAGYTTPEAVVEEWMNSPGHRDNILNPAFTEIGVGHYLLENDTGNVNWNHYWTTVFHDG